mgnify:CR=1 FL=1
MNTKTNTIFIIFLITSVNFLLAGDFSVGADIYNRYVWRGTDYGNSAAVQPYISYTSGPIEIGAWSSWSITDVSGGNENDLYLSYSYKSISLTLTDYFFPSYNGDDQIDKFGDQGGHTFEFSINADISNFSFLAAANLAGNDPNNSKYAEVSYKFYSKNKIESSLFLGAGDYLYSLDNEFAIVNIGLQVSRDIFQAAYIVNPDQRTSFLTFAVSL